MNVPSIAPTTSTLDIELAHSLLDMSTWFPKMEDTIEVDDVDIKKWKKELDLDMNFKILLTEMQGMRENANKRQEIELLEREL